MNIKKHIVKLKYTFCWYIFHTAFISNLYWKVDWTSKAMAAAVRPHTDFGKSVCSPFLLFFSTNTADAFLPAEREVLPRYPGSCSQSKGPWWEGGRPWHWNRNRPSVHDGHHCRSWLLLCRGGRDALPAFTGLGLLINRCNRFTYFHCAVSPKKCSICPVVKCKTN